jgi:hypothetical protein
MGRVYSVGTLDGMTANRELLRPIDPPIDPPSRWTETTLPSYRHVPGLTPHPINSPQGHSSGEFEVDLGSRINTFPDTWLDCPAYLQGVDLFNLSFFWESHEAWEEVWNAVGHQTLSGRMLQGMIQVAASLLKDHVGSKVGATRNFRKACRHFDFVEAELSAEMPTAVCFLGVQISQWRLEIADYLDRRSSRLPFLRLRPD